MIRRIKIALIEFSALLAGVSLVHFTGFGVKAKATPLAGATLTVNSTADTDNNADTLLTLREAILISNGTRAVGAGEAAQVSGTPGSGLDNIVFNLGAGTPTIAVTSALPTITNPMNINGNTGGSTRVELNGAGAGAGVNGLTITAGSSTIQGLVINRFGGNGILIQTSGSNTIKNCYIGTNAAGTAALANGSDGVNINAGMSNTVGGTSAGERNLIFGNGTEGVEILAGSGNMVLGNLISKNTGNGVRISGGSASNKIAGNLIGTDLAGTAAQANGSDGVNISAGMSNTVGGTNAGEPNIIAFNQGNGVTVSSGTGNAILTNSIHSNSKLGIDLGNDGVTANDNNVQDADPGPNNLQNFPALTQAVFFNNGSPTTKVTGTLDSTASRSFTIQFFANAVCDPSGNGEGQTFLGQTTVTTNASGMASFSASLAATTAAGQFVTATATDNMTNDTSEFSKCQAVIAPTLSINDVTMNEGNSGTTAFTFTVTLAGANGLQDSVTVDYATANNTATAPSDYTARPTTTMTFTGPIASNSVTQTISVLVNGDMTNEPDETFFVNLSNANLATIVKAQGVGTIKNDDLPPQLKVTLFDPAVCTGPGNVVQVTATVTNPNVYTQTATFNAMLSGLLALPGTGTASINQAGLIITPSLVTWSGTLTAGQTVTISYKAQVADNAAPGADLCVTSTATLQNGGTANTTACVKVNCPVVGPGAPPPAAAAVSDQKPGSVLFYNLYTSNVADLTRQNTRINLTNTDPARSVAVHLFFVDGSTCTPADSYVCLTPNQTLSFLASDVDPGTTGYIVAVASDKDTGCPVNFNFLIGDEFVKLSSGHQANLTAESFVALAGGLPLCDATSITATLNFDGMSYNQVPRVLAVDNFPSPADGNNTLLVLNRIGGDLSSGASTIGSLFGVLYDEAEQPLSFTLSSNTCQLRGSLNNSFLRTTQRLETVISAGRTGWLRLWGVNDIGLLGSVINLNASAGVNNFSQGHNLHKLTFTASASLTIPIIPPACQ